MIRDVRGKLPEIAPLRRGFSPCRVMGADTETWINPKSGLCEVISLQFAGDDFPPELIYCDNTNALAQFMAVLDEWTKKGTRNVVFFHNLSYDLQALLLNFPEYLETLAILNRVTITWPGVEFEITAGKSWFARVRFGKHRRVKILDTFKFTFTSLDKSAKIFQLEANKLKPPAGLGKKRFRNHAKFEAYSIQDAIVEYQLGKKLIDLHESLDCPLSVSAAQLSAFSFRRQFLHEPFARPDAECEQMALQSFHGGLTRATPGFYPNLQEFDFVSAYPAAMVELGRPVAFRRVSSYAGENAVYHVRGKCLDSRHPILFTPDFKPLLETDYTFVTGYELKSAMDRGEFRGSILRGFVVEFDTTNNPFRSFVDHFFAEKDAAKRSGDTARAHMVKRILNSLYGKTIQTQETDGEDYYTPGGLYHPTVATLITGSVRAKLHALEHDAHAVHSATDSIKTDRFFEINSGLGGLTLECSGPAVVVRGKLYAHKDEQSGNWKFASHGLGVYPPSEAWRQLISTGKTTKQRVLGVKTAYRRQLAPLTWLDFETKLRSEVPEMPLDFLSELLDYLD